MQRCVGSWYASSSCADMSSQSSTTPTNQYTVPDGLQQTSGTSHDGFVGGIKRNRHAQRRFVQEYILLADQDRDGGP